MRTLPDIDTLAAAGPFVATIGMFDGPHRGHERLLATVAREARRLSAAPTLITFVPHPDAVLRAGPPPLLSDPAETRARLARAGVAWFVPQPFERAFAAQPAEVFLRRLAAGGNLRALALTSESRLGHDRSGTAAGLAPLARRLGAEILVVEPLSLAGERVSSSRIRQLMAAGGLGQARALLGRRPAVVGTVVHGDGRGRGLGFPTANLAFDAPVALPADGIYAVRVSWGGPDPLRPARTADGAASLGLRPTFGADGRLLEVFLLDFDEDLYGRRLRVEFVRRLRGERRFGSVEALVAQMGRDVAQVRGLLGS
ncbi:MAG: bifunctional riboflavin kinase/FMN adenylyltransferase [Candidatus Limnocylindrales bacterium]